MLCTRARVSGPTSVRPFSTFDTVAIDTPAEAATSASFGGPSLDGTAPPRRFGSVRADFTAVTRHSCDPYPSRTVVDASPGAATVKDAVRSAHVSWYSPR